MKKVNILIFIIAIFLSVTLIGCKGKEEEKKPEVEKPPTSLEDLQKLTDEVVLGTMKKDWSGSLTKTKELQSKWSELYPELQKKGVSKDNVDNFVKDLNALSDSLIAKTLKLPKEKKEEKKEEGSKSESTSGGESQGEESGGGSESAQSKEASAQSQDEPEGEKAEEKNKDPEKALEKVDPMMEINPDELVIVNSAVEILKHIPKFAGLFGGKVPADVLQLKYLLYHINVASKQGDWSEAAVTMEEMSDIWSSVEPKALETDEGLKFQIAQSIKELEGVVAEKNEKLIGMKSNATLEVVEKLITKFEEK